MKSYSFLNDFIDDHNSNLFLMSYSYCSEINILKLEIDLSNKKFRRSREKSYPNNFSKHIEIKIHFERLC